MSRFSLSEPLATGSIVPVALIVLIAGSLLYGVYNVHFHPLRNIPGPLLWRAYYFPFVNSHCKGQSPYKLREFHARYGPVVRHSPGQVSFITPDAWNDIYGLLPGRIQNQKDRHSFMAGITGIFVANDSEHFHRRKLLTSSFSSGALAAIEPSFTGYASLMVTQLKRELSTGRAVQDLALWLNWTTFDFNGEFTFGESFHCLDRTETHPWLNTILDGLVTGISLSQLERYGIYTLATNLLPRSVFKAKDEMDNYSMHHVDERLEHGVGLQPDLFSNILRDQKSLDQRDREALYSDCTTMVMAGAETTATLLTGLIWYLLQNPDKYERLKKEVRGAFDSDEQINNARTSHLEYLVAVLQEGLRMFPPVPAGMARTISTDGQVVSGIPLPKGTVASVFQLPAFHSHANFTRADEFIPERWLPEGKDEFANDRHAVFSPFSVGPRNCLGKTLAYIEMRIILSLILFNFDLELAPGEDTWLDRCIPYTLWYKPPLMVKMGIR